MNNDLKEKRLAICEQCLLYKIDEFYGPVYYIFFNFLW